LITAGGSFLMFTPSFELLPLPTRPASDTEVPLHALQSAQLTTGDGFRNFGNAVTKYVHNVSQFVILLRNLLFLCFFPRFAMPESRIWSGLLVNSVIFL